MGHETPCPVSYTYRSKALVDVNVRIGVSVRRTAIVHHTHTQVLEIPGSVHMFRKRIPDLFESYLASLHPPVVVELYPVYLIL